ncbi:response regulator transcription factor [bacterium]|nr:response regulator transcription factor [bacterium]
MKKNILIVEDHELTRLGLKTTFDGVEFVEKAFEAESAEIALDIVKNNKIDLVIMDLGLPNMNGIDAAQAIKKYNNDIKIIMLTSHNEEKEVLDSLKAGVNAYCSKEIKLPRLVEVVSSVLDGAAWFDPSIAQFVLRAATDTGLPIVNDSKNIYNLTTREKQILKLITEGCSNSEIADKLFVSINTTKAHVANILQKLEVEDRLQAAVKAFKNHIV